MNKLEQISFKDKKAIFDRLERIASQANLTKEERARLDEEWKIYNDYFNTMDGAREQGFEQGRQAGWEQGLKQGEEQGRLEEQRKIAKGLKEAGTSIQLIAQVTGLSETDIESL